MAFYDLLLTGMTPSGRAYEVQRFRGGAPRDRFLLPVGSVILVGTRIERLGQVACNTIATFEIPDWLARTRLISPEIDFVPEDVLASYFPEDPEDAQDMEI